MAAADHPPYETDHQDPEHTPDTGKTCAPPNASSATTRHPPSTTPSQITPKPKPGPGPHAALGDIAASPVTAGPNGAGARGTTPGPLRHALQPAPERLHVPIQTALRQPPRRTLTTQQQVQPQLTTHMGHY